MPLSGPDRIKELWPVGKTRPVEHVFTPAKIKHIGARYKMAIYTHHGVKDQQRAVKSVPWHEADYQESTVEQKQHYHRFCDVGIDSWCQFQAHVANKLPLVNFIKTDTLEYGTNERKPWTEGIYAGMDSVQPCAWAELLNIFISASTDELMMRCSRQSTTNMNESIHQKVAVMVHKCKCHLTDAIEFATQHIMMSQNFGYHDSSFLNVLGWTTKSTSRCLKAKDKVSLESSARKHKGNFVDTCQHRKKVRNIYVNEREHVAAMNVGVSSGSVPNQVGGNPSVVNSGASGSSRQVNVVNDPVSDSEASDSGASASGANASAYGTMTAD